MSAEVLSANEEQLAAIKDAITHLYDVHDHYYTRDKRAKKELLKRLQLGILATITSLDSTHWEPPEKAKLLHFHGRVLDVLPEYSAEAEAHVTRAVKLDPLCWEAWNTLGSIFYKKQDFKSSLEAFESSVAAKPNAPALRDASIVLRQVPDSSAAADNVRLSITKAKAAAALDLKSFENWTVLGTANLACFFAVTRDFEDLRKANQAYARALSLEAAQFEPGAAASGPQPRVPGTWEPQPLRMDPDLHFNRGQALMFQEAYGPAVAEFKLVLETDPGLPSQAQLDAIRTHATRIVGLVARKGHAKAKRLRDLTASLQVPASGLSAAEASFIGDRALVPFSGLAPGVNTGKALRCKALAPVSKSDSPPATLIAIDAAGEAIAVSVYFMREAQTAALTDRDALIILDPVLVSVSVDVAEIDRVLDAPAAAEVPAGTAAATAAGAAGARDSSTAAGAPPPQLVTYVTIQVQQRTALAVNGRAMDARSAGAALSGTFGVSVPT